MGVEFSPRSDTPRSLDQDGGQERQSPRRVRMRDLRALQANVDKGFSRISKMESAVNDVHRKLEDGMVDLWQKCGTIDKEWRSLRALLRGAPVACAASSSSSLATSTAAGLLHLAAPGLPIEDFAGYVAEFKSVKVAVEDMRHDIQDIVAVQEGRDRLFRANVKLAVKQLRDEVRGERGTKAKGSNKTAPTSNKNRKGQRTPVQSPRVPETVQGENADIVKEAGQQQRGDHRGEANLAETVDLQDHSKAVCEQVEALDRALAAMRDAQLASSAAIAATVLSDGQQTQEVATTPRRSPRSPRNTPRGVPAAVIDIANPQKDVQPIETKRMYTDATSQREKASQDEGTPQRLLSCDTLKSHGHRSALQARFIEQRALLMQQQHQQYRESQKKQQKQQQQQQQHLPDQQSAVGDLDDGWQVDMREAREMPAHESYLLTPRMESHRQMTSDKATEEATAACSQQQQTSPEPLIADLVPQSPMPGQNSPARQLRPLHLQGCDDSPVVQAIVLSPPQQAQTQQSTPVHTPKLPQLQQQPSQPQLVQPPVQQSGQIQQGACGQRVMSTSSLTLRHQNWPPVPGGAASPPRQNGSPAVPGSPQKIPAAALARWEGRAAPMPRTSGSCLIPGPSCTTPNAQAMAQPCAADSRPRSTSLRKALEMQGHVSRERQNWLPRPPAPASPARRASGQLPGTKSPRKIPASALAPWQQTVGNPSSPRRSPSQTRMPHVAEPVQVRVEEQS